MPTTKQENLAKLRVENPTLEKGKLVELGGYSPAIIKTPAKALESKGYKEALRELGLTEELISKSLVQDIKRKPKKRIAELRLGAEILGMTENKDAQGNKTLIINVTPETAERYGLIPTPNTENSSS